MEYEFADIFDVPALTRLCEKFTRLTGKTTAILDLDGNVHISSGWQDLCGNFHRNNPGTADHCKQSDTVLARRLTAGGNYQVYQCRNGLLEVVVPLVVDGSHVGNLFTGQFLVELPDEVQSTEQAHSFDLDPAYYLGAVRRVPVFDERDVRLTIDFLVELAEIIGETATRDLRLRASKETQRADLRHSEALLRRAQQLAQVGSWEFDFRSNVLTWSDETFRIFEIDQNATEPDFDLIIQRTHPDDREATLGIFNEAMKQGQTYDVEHRLLFEDGRIKYVRELGYTTRDDNGKLLLFMGTTQDITEKKQLENEIRRAAHYDHLTDLPNRNLLADRFKQALASARRSQSFGALLYIDLDNFKPLNDTHGHDAGDLLLQEIGARLDRAIRGTDTAARFGGDEFLILLTSLSTERDAAAVEAMRIAEKVHSLLSADYQLSLAGRKGQIKALTHRCSASIGIALFDARCRNLEEVVQCADRAMYDVKRSGKSGIRFCDTGTDEAG